MHFASLRCRPQAVGCGRAPRTGSVEELDLEALEPVPDLGSYAPPSAATAQDVQADPKAAVYCGQACRIQQPSFGEELLNPGDLVPYAANDDSAPKVSLEESEVPYAALEDEGEEEAMTESQQLVQDLANVKRSVGFLHKLVVLLAVLALVMAAMLVFTVYTELSPTEQAAARRYVLLASIPIVALLFTWFHIWLAIQMMFLPLNFVGLWQYGATGMGVGWQGLVPRKCDKMARMSYKCARPYLEGPRDWLGRVDSKRLVEEVRGELRTVIDDAVSSAMKKYLPRTDNRMPQSMRSRLTDQALDRIQETSPQLWTTITELLCNEQIGIDNDGLIVKVFTENKPLLNEFFLRLGDQEFRFIEHCGAMMGFLCGLLQLIAFNHLSDEGRAIFLPATGFLLGIVTNWLAILMVFKPCFPTPIRICGWHICNIQGLFLKRQPEVCVLYAKMLKENFLSFNKIIGYLQTLPELWEKLKAAYVAHSTAVLRETLGSATWFAQWTIGKEGYRDLERDLKVAMVDGLYRAHRLHKVSAQYISKVTDIEARNRECLQRMPADEFENLLHPVFQEDEWILILLRGILGAIVGIVQVYCLSD